MNNINLEEFKKDYYNSMPYEELLLKYNIKDFYYRAIRKKLGLSRPKIKRLDYIFNINNLSNETDNLPVNKPVNIPANKPTNKPVDKPAKKKHSKTNVNIKTIETDNGVPEYEIKKCDTTYNADKSKLLDALKLSKKK
jgi:hypothetical protein